MPTYRLNFNLLVYVPVHAMYLPLLHTIFCIPIKATVNARSNLDTCTCMYYFHNISFGKLPQIILSYAFSSGGLDVGI